MASSELGGFRAVGALRQDRDDLFIREPAFCALILRQ